MDIPGEILLLRDKLKNLQRLNDQLQFQLSKPKTLQESKNQLLEEINIQSNRIIQLQSHVIFLENQNEQLKQDIILSSEIPLKPVCVLPEHPLSKDIQLLLIQDCPTELPLLREWLVFPDNSTLQSAVDELVFHLLSVKSFLRKHLKSLLVFLPKEVTVTLVKNMEPGKSADLLLEVLRCGVPDADLVWDCLLLSLEMMKASEQQKIWLQIATACLTNKEFRKSAYFNRVQLEQTELILMASHALRVPDLMTAAMDILFVLGMRSADVIAFASIRCHSNCWNIAQRILLMAINVTFGCQDSASHALLVNKGIAVLAKICRSKMERKNVLSFKNTMNSSVSSNDALEFRPPPIFGHLIEFPEALVEGVRMKPGLEAKANQLDLATLLLTANW